MPSMMLPLPFGRFSPFITSWLHLKRGSGLYPPQVAVPFTAYLSFVLNWEQKGSFQLRQPNPFFFPKSELVIIGAIQFPKTLKAPDLFFPKCLPTTNLVQCYFLEAILKSALFLCFHPHMKHHFSSQGIYLNQSHDHPKPREPGKCGPCLGFPVTMPRKGVPIFSEELTNELYLPQNIWKNINTLLCISQLMKE